MEQIYRISRAAIELSKAHEVLCEQARAQRSADPYGVQVAAPDDKCIEVSWANQTAKSSQRVVRSKNGLLTLEYVFFVDVHLETVCIGAIYMDVEGGFWRDAEQTVQAFYSGTIDALGKFVAKKMLDSEAFAPMKFTSSE